MKKCNQYEYESALTPNAVKQIGGNSVVMVVDSLGSITDPQPNYIYIVNGISYIYADGQFKVLGGKDNRPTVTDKGNGIVEIAY